MGSDPNPLPDGSPAVDPAEAGAPSPASPPAASTPAPVNANAAPAQPPEPASRAFLSSPPASQPGLDDTAMVFPSELSAWNGRIIDDRYRIARLLGEGGMGAVFVAEHLSLRKAVAFKVVRAELAGNGEVAARFAREAMATAQFEHPHVASAIDYGTLPEGGAYFVMQLVRGRSLRSLLASAKQLPWRRVAELAAQVADALSAAKAVGIIHRDLKPDNILVEQREDGSELVKVLDFGIAHVAPRDAPSPDGVHRTLTRVGTVMGTPGYMAPEQAIGDKVDHRADLYALGVVIWECIAGRELWDGPDLTTVVTKQMTENVPRLREIVTDVSLPAELDELVQRMTARAVGERPEHAAEIRDALRKLTAAREPSFAALTALGGFMPRMRAVLAQYKAQPAGVRRVRAGVALATMAILGAFFALGLRGSDDARITPSAEVVATSPGGPAVRDAGAPSVLEKVVAAATRVVQPGQATLAKPATPALPAELEASVDQLLDGKTARDRRAAGLKLLAYKPRERVFPHLIAIAELETTRSCKARKDVIAKMKTSGDPRYLPALRRLDRSPRSGCGFLSLGDCLSCVRAPLREAVDALERVQLDSAAPDKEP